MIINALVNFRGTDWISNLVSFRTPLNFWWDGYILDEVEELKHFKGHLLFCLTCAVVNINSILESHSDNSARFSLNVSPSY